MPGPADEHILIESVRRGDQAAFGILVKRYERYVYTLVLRYVNTREAAEELAQDVFLKAFRSLPGFQFKSKFSTWLYTIVHSTCVSYLRNKKRSEMLPGDDKLLYFSSQQQDREGPGDALDRKSRAKMIELALKSMPDDERRIISLYYQAEQSLAEIAMVTGHSTANIKIKLFRGRQKLKALLAHTFKEYLT